MLSLIHDYVFEQGVFGVIQIIVLLEFTCLMITVIFAPIIEPTQKLLNAPMSYAIRYDNIRLLQIARFLGCDPNKRDELGFAPLAYALKNNSEDLAVLLLCYGANINNFSNESLTLEYAVENNNKKIALFALRHKASYCTHCYRNYSVLDIAIEHKNFEMAQLLIDMLPTASLERVTYYFDKAIYHDVLLIAKSLIKKWPNIDINREDPITKKTPLMMAAKNSGSEMITFLYQNGADITKKNFYGETALILANLQNKNMIHRLTLR